MLVNERSQMSRWAKVLFLYISISLHLDLLNKGATFQRSRNISKCMFSKKVSISFNFYNKDEDFLIFKKLRF